MHGLVTGALTERDGYLDDLKAVTQELGKDFGLTWDPKVERTAVKGMDINGNWTEGGLGRIVEKLQEGRKVTDALRSTIMLPQDAAPRSAEYIEGVRAAMMARGYDVYLKNGKEDIDDRFLNPTTEGYRDIAFKFTKNGVVRELQLIQEHMRQVKNGRGHEILEELQGRLGKQLDPKDRIRLQEEAKELNGYAVRLDNPSLFGGTLPASTQDAMPNAQPSRASSEEYGMGPGNPSTSALSPTSSSNVYPPHPLARSSSTVGNVRSDISITSNKSIPQSAEGTPPYNQSKDTPFSTAAPDTRYSTANGEATQEISSKDTSLNQVPATFRRVRWQPGTRNFDLGVGRSALFTDALKGRGVENISYDPFWKDNAENKAIVDEVLQNPTDTATVNNVLNVIKEQAARRETIRQAARVLKPDGTAYFLIHEGDKSGNGKQTSKGWQNNQPAQEYIDEVTQYFESVKRKGNILEATGPKNTAGSLSPVEGDVRFSTRRENSPNNAMQQQLDSIANGKYADSIDIPINEMRYSTADIRHLEFGGRRKYVPPTENTENALLTLKSMIFYEAETLSDLIDPKSRMWGPRVNQSVVEYARAYFTGDGLKALQKSLEQESPPDYVTNPAYWWSVKGMLKEVREYQSPRPSLGKRLLASNVKTGGYSVDFPLTTCLPTTACDVCYAKPAAYIKNLAPSRVRFALISALEPEKTGEVIADFIKSVPKGEMPFLRINGAGDTTFQWQADMVNAIIARLDRSVHIFSRSHKSRAEGTVGLDAISNGHYEYDVNDDPATMSKKIANGVAVYKMGSIDAQLYKEYGIDYLKNNLRERGIINSYLVRGPEDVPILLELKEAGVQFIMHVNSNKKTMDALRAANLLSGFNVDFSAPACACSLDTGPKTNGCAQCLLAGGPCFTAGFNLLMTPDGNLYTMNDFVENNPEVTKAVPLNSIGLPSGMGRRKIHQQVIATTYRRAAHDILAKIRTSQRKGQNIVVEDPFTRVELIKGKTDDIYSAVRTLAESWNKWADEIETKRPTSNNPKFSEALDKSRMDAAMERAAGDTRYSTSNPEKMRVAKKAMEGAKDYLDNLEAAYNGELDPRRMLLIGDTPKVLQRLGAGNLKFYINSGKIVKIRNEHPEITLEMLRQIPQELHIPVSVMRSSLKSTNPTGFVILTTLRDTKKKPVIAAIHMDVFKVNRDINEVASIYGKKELDSLQEWTDTGTVYIDKERAPEVFLSIGLQLPVEETLQGHERIILHDTDIFNAPDTPFATGSGRAANRTLAGDDAEGRPDLANPGLNDEARRGMRVADEYTYKDQERKRDEDTIAEAATLDRDKVRQKIMAGQGLSDAETLAGQEIITEAYGEAMRSGNLGAMRRAVKLAHGWRVGGRELARSMRMRRDQMQTPAQRFEQALGAAFILPNKNVTSIQEQLGKDNISDQTRSELEQELEKELKKLALENARLRLKLARRGLVIDKLKRDLENAKTEREKQQAEDDAIDAVRDVMAARKGVGDALYEYWISSLLSGPGTQVVNISSNVVHTVWELGPQRIIEAFVNSFASKAEAAQWGEFKYMGAALKPGLSRALRNMVRSWKTERPTFQEELDRSQVEGSTIGLTTEYRGGAMDKYVGKRMARAIRIPLRGLMALDEFTKSMAGQMDAAAHAYRIGKGRGLRGDELEDFIQEQVDDLSSAAWEAGLNTALRVTFQTPLSPGAERASQWLGNTPGKWIIPFRRTPLNIFKTGIRKLPFGTWSTVKHWKTMDNDTKVRMLSEQVIAWSLAAAIAGLVLGGDDDDEPWITGSIPYKPSARGETLLKERTIPAQSIRIGGKYYSYARIEPFATILQGLVDATVAVKEIQSGRPAVGAGLDLLSKSMEAVTDKTFLRGLGDIYDALKQPESKGVSWVTNFATSWAPNIVKQVARATDSVYREQSLGKGGDYFDRLRDRIEYRVIPKADMLPPKRTPWGEEIRKIEGASPATDFFYRLLSPIANTTPAGRDPRAVKLDRLLTNWNNAHWDDTWAPEPPDRYITHNNTRYDLSDAEYDQLIKQCGEIALEHLEAYSLNSDFLTSSGLFNNYSESGSALF